MDTSEYLGLFLDESGESLQALNASLLALEREPADPAPLTVIVRVAHSLRGMSATMGLEAMARLTHRMEEVLATMPDDGAPVTADVSDALFACLDTLQQMVDRVAASDPEEVDASDVMARLDAIAKAGPGPGADPAGPPAGEVAPLPERGVRVLLDGLPGGPWPTVVDGRDGDVLALAAPRLGGHVVRLPLRRCLVAYAHREVPCEVAAELFDGPGDDTVAPYLARVTGAARRMQRRSAVRVPIHLMAQASVGDDHDGVPLGAVTENLSAGGALMRVAHPIAVGEAVRVRLQCGGDGGTLEFGASVVRCDRTPGDQRPWRVALAFPGMSPGDEDRLVRFIFERQRELRSGASGLA